jgi:hypothetical protein
LPPKQGLKAAELLQTLEDISRELQLLTLSPIEALPMAVVPIDGLGDQHHVGPHDAGHLPLDVSNEEIEPEPINENPQQEGPQRKRRRVSRPKGQLPTRRSNRLAGTPPADMLFVVPEVAPQVAPEVMAPPVAPEVMAPQNLPIAQEEVAPIAADAPEVAAPVVIVEPAAVVDALAQVVDVDPDHVMGNVPELNECVNQEPMEADEQQQDLPVVPAVPLTRRQQRYLAKTEGWTAFLTPLPEDLPEGELGPRKAARVCRAKNKYLAVALRPNLCE